MTSRTVSRWNSEREIHKLSPQQSPYLRRDFAALTGAEMTEYNQARKVASLLEAIAEPTRLHILWQLAKGPLNVGKLADVTKIRMVNMSHHLGVMKNAGVLEDTREGRNVIYKLNPAYFTAGTSEGVLGVLALGKFRVLLRKKPEKPLAVPKARVRRKYTRRS